MIKAELLALQAKLLRAIAADLDRMARGIVDQDVGNEVVSTSDTLTFKMPDIGSSVLYRCTQCDHTFLSLKDWGDTLNHTRPGWYDQHTMKKVS